MGTSPRASGLGAVATTIAIAAIAFAGCAVGSSDVAEGASSPGAPSGDDAAASDPGSFASDSGASSNADASSPQPDAGAIDAASGGHDSAAPDSSPVVSGCTFTGALATFDLSGQPGNESSVPAKSTAAGVTASALARSSALTAVSGTGSINGSGFSSTQSADPARYFSFTITPPSGCTVSLAQLALDIKASSTGPTSGDVATSADNFASHSASFAGTSTPTVALSASGSGAIEVRIYGYGASGTAGTLRIENTLTLSGSMQ